MAKVSFSVEFRSGLFVVVSLRSITSIICSVGISKATEMLHLRPHTKKGLVVLKNGVTQCRYPHIMKGIGIGANPVIRDQSRNLR